MELRYDGPGRLLCIPGKKDTPQGGTVVVSKATAEQLLANPSIHVTVVDDIDETDGQPAAETTNTTAEPELADADHEEGT